MSTRKGLISQSSAALDEIMVIEKTLTRNEWFHTQPPVSHSSKDFSWLLPGKKLNRERMKSSVLAHCLREPKTFPKLQSDVLDVILERTSILMRIARLEETLSKIQEQLLPKLSPIRKRELKWMQGHRKTLSHYAAQWVVIQGDTVISHSSKASVAIQDARDKGIATPFVVFIES